MKKKLILDYSTWRCGGERDTDKYKLGVGDTQLLNGYGYMCCLGQFSLQLKPELTKSEILNKAFPEDLGYEIDMLTSPDFDYEAGYRNTSLSDDAADINDRTETTPEEKIQELKVLFLLEGYEIDVINKP